ncbi:DUF7673 family protein [Microbulbifer sp. JTAC008]|uniref:DUF7673 family protein n=1 Tax=Microbulbifer sp. JTAC008 TaxID=3243374 RepID=UPI00403A46D4
MNQNNPAHSVETLLTVANRHTGASEIAAQVLLSAWNSSAFAVPVADLALLDSANYQHAINVMTLRYHCKEPQRVIPNGDKKFHALYREWNHLEIQRKEAA